MSRLIFDAATLSGTTTLDSEDSVGTFVITVPAANGTMSVKDASGDATFRNLTLTGAVLAGAWNGTAVTVPYGGTGATTLTGYTKGNGTAAFTASATIPSTDITGLGTMSVQNASAVAITGGTANGMTLGATTPAAAIVTTLRVNSTISLAGLTGTTGQVLTSNGASAPTWQNIAGSGTVTSIDVSGGTTGLTTSGGPVTAAGTITLAGTLALSNGGTNAALTASAGAVSYSTTSALALSAVGTAGQVLTSAGAGAPTWATLATNVSSFSAGSTGLTPNTATTGAVTLAGILALANGGTNAALTASAGAVTYSTASALALSAVGTLGQVLTSSGAGAPTWATAAGGVTLANDTATATNLYPTFAAATSGSVSTIYTGNANLLYKPSTGELQSIAMVSSNGITVNSSTVSANYTIATGFNAVSAGPVTINSGVVVTVSSGSTWVVV